MKIVDKQYIIGSIEAQNLSRKKSHLLLAFTFASITLISATKTFAAQNRNTSDDAALLVLATIAILLIAIGYMFPTIVAFGRGHPNRWVIGLLNFVFGATVLGWVGCLIWAFHRIHSPKSGGSTGGESGLNLYANDEKLVRITGYPAMALAGPANSDSHSFREPTFDLIYRDRPLQAPPGPENQNSPPIVTVDHSASIPNFDPSPEPPPTRKDRTDIWFYVKGDENVGPTSATEIRQQLHFRQIKPTTLVWREGMDDWRPLSETELSSPSEEGEYNRSPPTALRQKTGINVPFRNPKTDEIKFVKVGWSWTLFFFASILGIPLFLRKLNALGTVFLVFWCANFLSAESNMSVRLGLGLVAIGMAFWIGFKGNELTAKNYLNIGWLFAEPNSDATRFGKLHWNIR